MATFRMFAFENLAVWHLCLCATTNEGREMAPCSSIARLPLPQTQAPSLCWKRQTEERGLHSVPGQQAAAFRPKTVLGIPLQTPESPVPGHDAGRWGRSERLLVFWKLPAALTNVRRGTYDGTRVKSESGWPEWGPQSTGTGFYIIRATE